MATGMVGAAAVDVARRPAVQFLNFDGNVVKSIEERFPTDEDRRPGLDRPDDDERQLSIRLKAFGPNTLRELLHPVTAIYDPETDRTRVGLSYLAPTTRTPREEAR